MRNQPETLHEYNIPRLHWWFLLSSAVFLGTLVLMVWVDYSGGEIRWLGVRGDREWKNYQRQFYDWDKKRLKFDAQAAELKASEAGLQKDKEELVTVETQLASKKVEEDAARQALDKAQVELFLITREFTMRKADRDQYRSFYEAALERKNMNADDPEVRDLKDTVESLNSRVATLDLRKQEADAMVEAARAKFEQIVGEKQKLESQIKQLTGGINLLTKRYKELTDPFVQGVVNAPILEFAAPTYKVEQIIADNHHVDVNFATVPRVDRCITCHKAVDRKDLSPEELEWRAKNKLEAIEWSKLPQPLRNHPHIDLFVGDTSPHPMSKYGCTTCHWGWDRETGFSRAGHMPDEEEKQPYTFDDAARKWVRVSMEGGEAHASPTVPKDKIIKEMTQKEAWEKNYHWEHQEFLLQPMRAAKYVQASCLKCHANETNLSGGQQLDHGRRLIEQLGCWSCHKMKPMETYATHKVRAGEDLEGICKFYDVSIDEVCRLNPTKLQQAGGVKVDMELDIPIRTLRKPGPSLYKIASKDNKEWTRKWLENPVAFRPNTYMPRFWGLDNNKDPGRDTVEINAITEFLFAVSDAAQYPPPPMKGDAENGKKLAEQVGCMGCHVVDERLTDIKPPANLAKYLDEWQYRRLRSQGPQLAGAGSKTTLNWLYAWLKNPKQYHPQTKMPNLRLSDQEAADLATYLAGLHNEQTDKQTLPAVNPQRLDQVTLEYLEVTMSQDTAVEKLARVDFADVIESFFADEEIIPYFRNRGRLEREENQQETLKKKFEEEFDDAVGRQADQLAAHIKQVKAKMQAAREKAASLSADQKKNVFLGSKLIGRYGCFACHNIRGFEDARSIGTELSVWGSKPITQIDFGLLEMEHNRIAFLKQKLHAPRSYDTGRIGITRMPQELLKMPKFNLTDEQIDQIVTVITGMTDEKLTPNEARQLTPAEFNIERGRWLVKELNCQGCHLVEGRGWAIRAAGIASGMEPPMLSGTPTQLHQGQRTQPQWLFSFLKSPQTGQVRPWLKARMPTFELTDAEANVLVRYFALEGRTQFPYKTPPQVGSDEVAAGKQMFDQLKCGLCHIVEGKALGKPLAEIPEEDLPRLAPNLSMAHDRLQRDWVINKWLPDPLSQQPGTRMPQFEYGAGLPKPISELFGGDPRKQIEALADYVLSLGAPPPQTAAAPVAPPAPAPAAPAEPEKMNEPAPKPSDQRGQL